ncbi:mas-related G-protein coupled receptor member H-like [Crotalus adamanteus]|uniref:Mas-related G-protein coupled receptor member H-like n=1 Tax=Crotalus adamanteus TaxID=8729 RepID=A0AAW1BLY7_CROAD
MLGNGLVIWLLGFSIKRNTFAIYFLNLSVADFGLLTTELIIEIHWFFTHLYCDFPYELFQTVLLLMYSAGQFLLTVISIDRCISVLFPIWYRCHRPVHLFTAVCAVIWATSFILSSIYFTIAAIHRYEPKYTQEYLKPQKQDWSIMNMTSPSPFSALALINATYCGKSKTGNESSVNEAINV